MKIFFLVPYYFDLHKPILNELNRQGHEVFVEQDIQLPLDPNRKSEWRVVRFLKRVIRRVTKLEIRYWDRKIKSVSQYNDHFDLFLCINGCSFHPFLLDNLKKKNPCIKSVLYLWDTNKYYDYFRYNKYYNRVVTFDLDDAESEPYVELMHSYWIPSECKDVKYCIFSVGSDHDDRIEIYSKIYSQLKGLHYSSFIKLVIQKPQYLPFVIRIMRIGRYNYKKELSVYEKKKELPFVTEKKFSIESIINYIDESVCILDTDMPIQTGVTQRVIWALARGKKVISTNSNLKRLTFYNGDQIKIIDRKNPIIDIDFINSKEIFPVCEEIQNLRIDKWVYNLIHLNCKA